MFSRLFGDEGTFAGFGERVRYLYVHDLKVLDYGDDVAVRT